MAKKFGLMKRVMGRMAAPMVRTMMAKPVRNMLGMLEMTEESEYSCEDAYAVLDLYADIAARGENPSALMPLVKRHLDMCTNCREEFEALLTAIQSVPAE